MVTDNRFIRACTGQPHDTVPVWFMRQAGRYQPSYRALRSRYSMLELARSPQHIRDVTLSPVMELGVDAAILFSDIMIPLSGMEMRFEIEENVGPVVDEPIRTGADLARLSRFRADAVDFVYEGVRLCAEALGNIPLIGFAGAPFTLGSYLVEGGPSRTYRYTKEWLWTDPPGFNALMELLSDMVVRYAMKQVEAGASALQIFDSWVGALSLADYRAVVLPHMRRLFSELSGLGVPLIYFGVGTQHLLADMATSGATVLGVDWRTPLSGVRGFVGEGLALMGNLDPWRLVAGRQAWEGEVKAILDVMADDPRYIFNLGHGVVKETDPSALRGLVQCVHDWGRQSRRGGVGA